MLNPDVQQTEGRESFLVTSAVITTEERIVPSTGTTTNQSLQLKSEYALYRIKKFSQENMTEKYLFWCSVQPPTACWFK